MQSASRYPKRYEFGFPKWYVIDRVRLEEGELLGSLHAEHKQCGKPNCRCASDRGEDLHGPYWYRRWRDENGEQRKAYVPKGDLGAVRAGIEKRRNRLRRERAERARWMRRGQGKDHPRDYWKRKNREQSIIKEIATLIESPNAML